MIRIFAHCGSSAAPEGAVTVMYANPQTEPIELDLGPGLGAGPRERYVLTPAPDGSRNSLRPALQSRKVALNGVALAMVGENQTELPAMTPSKTAPGAGNRLELPALSFGFVVLPSAAAPACKY